MVLRYTHVTTLFLPLVIHLHRKKFICGGIDFRTSMWGGGSSQLDETAERGRGVKKPDVIYGQPLKFNYQTIGLSMFSTDKIRDLGLLRASLEVYLRLQSYFTMLRINEAKCPIIERS